VEVCVRVPSALREVVGGASRVVVDVDGDGSESAVGDATAVTVAAVLDVLAVRHPALERRVRDELGRRRAHVNLFVGADNVRDRDGLTTPVRAGEELSIIPAVSGG
jgi:sulfur-carrier protein